MNVLTFIKNPNMNRYKLLYCVLYTMAITSVLSSQALAQCFIPSSGNIYQISTDADGGPGSLRQAILDANSDNTGGAIEFAPGWFFINFPIFSPLPAITCDSLVILDYFAPITIDGQNMIPGPGLVFNAPTICLGSMVSGINFLQGTIWVTNTNDAGTGSLRAAIKSANFSSNSDLIYFNVPGSAPHRIQVNSALPQIFYSLSIDGSTQPTNGYLGDAPKIELDGVTNSFTGLRFNGTLAVHQNNISVYGLYIHRFYVGLNTSACNNVLIGTTGKGNVISGNNYGIELSQDINVQVRNNYMGTDTSGSAPEGNVITGLSIVGYPGGTYLIQNNVISGNINWGVILYNTLRNVTIKGNLVGTDKTGIYAIPNGLVGISSSATNVTVGGILPGDGNLISGNCLPGPTSPKAGLYISGDSTTVIGNKFGTNLNGTDTIPNRNGSSILLEGRKNRIGGPSVAERNIFAGSPQGVTGYTGNDNIIQNNYFGTDITGTIPLPNRAAISLGSDSVLITSNKILFNETGIEFGSASSDNLIIQNEIGESQTWGIWNWGQKNKFSQNTIFNNGNKAILNFQNGNNNILPPLITYVSADSIKGTSLPNATVELYYNLSVNSHPQGNQFIATSIADGTGNWKYTGPISNPVEVTVIQTDSQNNSSEFSKLWPQVTNVVWPGDCNYDLIVDNLDFIFLGMAYGNSGPVRSNSSLNWIAQPANDWNSEFFNGINHKHADTNGDGVADGADTLAISQNYGFTHAQRLSENTISSATYELKITALNNLIAPGSMASYIIEAGSGSLPIPSLYGMKWSTLFNSSLVDTNNVSIDFSISSLGNFPADILSFKKSSWSANQLDAAVSRINQTNANNVNGLLGILHLPTKSTINSLEVLTPDFTSILGLTYSGQEVLFAFQSDSVVINPGVVGVESPLTAKAIWLFPNPASGLINIMSNKFELTQINILDFTGKEISMFEVNGNNAKLSLAHLSNGLKLIEVFTSDGQVSRHRILLNR
jgi:hypothetical protein